MSTTFQRCDLSVDELAKAIKEFPEHLLLKQFDVKIDFVFAYAEEGKSALKKNGVKALGITRRIPLKDRALGRGDAEIAIDAAFWKTAADLEKAALLDHELYHLTVDVESENQRDDLGRPKLKLRKHDYEFGWFTHIAERYGIHSQERQQAKRMMDDNGQLFWPEIETESNIKAMAFA